MAPFRAVAALLLALLVGSPCASLAKTYKADVVVVGAGIAGLSAALELKKSGVGSVLVVEGRKRLGGRALTITTKKGYKADLGTQLIVGTKNNPALDAAKRYGLATSKSNSFSFKAYNLATKRTFLLSSDYYANYEGTRFINLYGTFRSYCTEGTGQQYRSIGEAVSGMFKNKKAIRLLQLTAVDRSILEFGLDNIMSTQFGADYRSLPNPTVWAQLDAAQNGEAVILKDGLAALAGAMANDLRRQKVGVYRASVVTSVTWSGSQVVVKATNTMTKKTDTFIGKYAVITLPVGVLKRNTVKFNPSLPADKRRAISTIRVGAVEKTAFVYPTAFWDKPFEFLGRITKTPASWNNFYNYMKLAKRPMLVATNVGTYASGISKLSKNVQRTVIQTAMQSVYGKKAGKPSEVFTTNWATDPFAYGTTVYLPFGASKSVYSTFAKPAGRLYFAGEAADAQNPNTVGGIYRSGQVAARAIAQKLGKKG